MKTWIQRWGLAVLIMMLIFVASSIPGDRLPEFDQYDFDIKKAGHMLGYALLAMGLLRGLTYKNATTVRLLISAVLFSGIYAFTDEFHQRFTPGRSSSIVDVLIDTAGAAIGAGVWAWAKWTSASRRRA